MSVDPDMYGYGVYIPADHPALTHPKDHRVPVNGLRLDAQEKRITVVPGGWMDGPVVIGCSWKVERG